MTAGAVAAVGAAAVCSVGSDCAARRAHAIAKHPTRIATTPRVLLIFITTSRSFTASTGRSARVDSPQLIRRNLPSGYQQVLEQLSYLRNSCGRMGITKSLFVDS